MQQIRGGEASQSGADDGNTTFIAAIRWPSPWLMMHLKVSSDAYSCSFYLPIQQPRKGPHRTPIS
jgi:hypothetical protein